MNKIGIIAGEGNLAHIMTKACIKKDIQPFIIKISSASDREFSSYENIIFVKIGEVKKLIEFLKFNDVTKIIFAGKINRPRNFLEIKVDNVGAKLLARITANKIFGDNNILLKVKEFFSEQGFETISLPDIMSELVTSPGVLSKKLPSENDLANIKLGVDVINSISAFDIGQSIIVADKRVVAIEGAEGTDEMIRRSAQYIALNDGYLVKLPKIGQIKEIDLPCVGINTVKLAHKAGIKGIVVRSGATILLDRLQVIEFVDKYDIFLLSLDEEGRL